MSYIPPSLKDLCALAEEFEKHYTNGKAERLSFVALYKQLAPLKMDEEQKVNILVGALVFELTDVKFEEYGGASPVVGNGGFISWLASTGSSFYTFIKQKLNITASNKFGYDERIFYLHEFHKYFDTNYSEKNMSQLKEQTKLSPHPKWQTKENIQDNIKKELVHVFKQNSDQLYYLTHGIPGIDVLLDGLVNMDKEHAANSSNPTNPKRLAARNCIKFITEYYQLGNPTEESWQIFCGTVISVLIDLVNECTFFNPSATLYKAGLRTINQTSMANITNSDKIAWLTATQKFLNEINKKPDEYNAALKKVVEKTTDQDLTSDKLSKQIKDFKIQIDEQLAKLNEAKNTPSKAIAGVELASGYAFQHVAAPLALKACSLLVEGLVGTVVFSATGTILMSSVGRMLSQNALNGISAGLCNWLLEKVGGVVGKMTATVVTYPFSAEAKGLEEMRKMLKPRDDIAFVRFVNTLLELDFKECIDPDDKQSIRKLFGLKEGEYLQPLKTSLNNVEENAMQKKVMIEGQASRLFGGSKIVIVDDAAKPATSLKC